MRAQRTKWIKKKAHACTWAGVWFLIFFVPACFGLSSEEKESRLISAAIVSIQAVIVSSAVYFWLREPKQEVRWEIED